MARQTKKSKSKLWFLVHSWLALPIWFFVLIVCFTGMLAVVSQEIVWLANPDVRATKPNDDAERLSFQQVLDAMHKAEPDMVVRSLSQPDGSHFALTASATLADGTSRTLYVNPYTGAIQGKMPDFNFEAFTRALHGWWLVPFTNGYSWGWYLVSLLGLPMLASLVTGLVVYKKFWKGFFKLPRRSHGPRIFWGDLHRLAGVWSIWFIAVISITGTWFLIQAILADNHITISTEPVVPVIAREDVPRTEDGSPAPRIDLNEAQRIATTAIPGLDITFISLPGTAYSHISMGGRGWYPLMFQTAEVNPYTRNVDSQFLLSDRSTLEFVTESMRPLHTGDFGGLPIKLIWAFFGLILTLMVFSGLLIWTKRTAQATATALKRGEREARPRKAHSETTVEIQP
ncbi:PepSY domain-containing protein [Pseudomonas guariconensis]|uniref:PepSY-associated TM helix domain-containing protein n=1 Tax=Pseudomonas TaxID=286 RepID=UPI0020971BBC|nr:MULTISPECIES: PepSY domain-containing protein [Pseudomonas]MCO7640615.1 PepSY domain-containing protein [Pseudomonas sp. S 311-6]MCO7516303.1 PepSY domain-containing protein [Pseudomonas putida]MCO7566060.1 PepSY domain-containing protein [Pseudomonas mosselii]MCO7606311.1 PepSY domain-containing protein [Pseudomonas guariconensis]MCO7617227.1 PepSY domain-containing protein [Pseudomonas guariconensis]